LDGSAGAEVRDVVEHSHCNLLLMLPNHLGNDCARKRFSRACRGGGIPAPSGPHLELDGGYYRCGLQLKRNGKPCKELVKIAHPPIVRRSEAFVMPGTRWLSARAARRLLPPSEAAISQCSQACFLVERTSSPRGMSALGH
jgi:hypothetical protein